MHRCTLAILIALLVSPILADEITSPAASGSSAPFVASGPDGSLFMTWLEPGGGGAALKFAKYQKGRWSAPQTIADGAQIMVNWANSPAILAAGDRLYALWLQKRGQHGHAADAYMASSGDGGATWTKGRLIHRDGKETEHGFASLVPLGGDAGAAWLDGREMTGHDEGEMTLRYARISANGALSSEAVLDRRVCECCGTGMAMTASGPIVAYRDRSADEIRDISVVRLVGGRWSEPAIVHRDDWKLKGCPLNGPQIDARGKRVAVAWFTVANGTPKVMVAFSNDGGAKFAKALDIDAFAPAGRVDVLLLSEGDALVIWSEPSFIAVRRVSQSGTLGEVMSLGPTTLARSAGFPRAAIAGERVYVAWTDPNAKRIRVATLRMH